MDKIRKFFRRLTNKERAALAVMITRIHAGDLTGLDVKKLKGHPGLFRVRVGNFRAIFQKERKGVRLFSIGRRGKGTYKKI